MGIILVFWKDVMVVILVFKINCEGVKYFFYVNIVVGCES